MVSMPLSLSASMTRWKPSVSSWVSSCSVPGASDFAAVFSIGVSPLSLTRGRVDRLLKVQTNGSRRAKGSLSGKKFLAVRLDIGGKSKRVVAGALFSQLGIASLQRLDDR